MVFASRRPWAVFSMAWWQMLSISLVSGFGGAAFFGFVWWWMRKNSITLSISPGASQAAGSKVDPKRVKFKDEAMRLSRKVQVIVALQPPAEQVRQLIDRSVLEIEQGELQEETEEANNEGSSAGLDSEPKESPEEIDAKLPKDPFLLSTNFSEHRFKDLLGTGGFGRVELVEDPQTAGATFAWKALDKLQAEKSNMAQNVVTEKRILAVTKLCPSPFIVSYYGCCQTPKYVYFKLEALLGGDLYGIYIKNAFHGSKEHARYYMASALSAVNHLHQLRVMLRSLKPEDCGLDLYGTLKIFDFNLSKFVVSKSYTTCGTPDYFSPEIISSSGHSFPVDWWCAGVMLYELLAGAPPFESAYPMQIYQKVMQGIQRVNFKDKVPQEAKNLICSLCHEDPQKRLPEAKGFKALQQHAFFKHFDFEGLSRMTPPFKPSSEIKNYRSHESDLPACFREKADPTKLKGDFWSVHFGPMAENDEFPRENDMF